MPSYSYKCDGECKREKVVELSISDYVDSFDCDYWFDTLDSEENGSLYDCGGVFRRHYAGTAPALGKIDGAGRSPIRGQL